MLQAAFEFLSPAMILPIFRSKEFNCSLFFLHETSTMLILVFYFKSTSRSVVEPHGWKPVSHLYCIWLKYIFGAMAFLVYILDKTI